MNAAIIGCGLIGRKRALALGRHKLLFAVDLDIKKAEGVAALRPEAAVSDDFRNVIADSRVEIVIVSTTNDKLAEITLVAVESGKHVLVEKPAGRNPGEIEKVMKSAQRNKVVVKAGFNLRYHPSLLKAREIFNSGCMGELMFIRGRYGHGGRLGYDREWRADPAISGGGELIDQGVHMIDLCRWFLGDFVYVRGETATYFWDMPVDDNAFLCLQTEKKQTAWIHVSCTEWKNMFSLEIYGRTGKIQIDGLGGSYGMEKLTYYQMRPEMGPPDIESWEYPGEDSSWEREFKAFIDAIRSGSGLNGGINDAYEALKIVDKIYTGAGE